MVRLPADPFEPSGIVGFAERLRRGETTAAAATGAYLARIEALEPRLGAFEFVAAEQALSTARALDELLAAGTDLGPLMGVPVAIKDLLAVDGMPTTAGSNLDVTEVIGPEGDFVKMLKRAGCIILGKTKTDEFALGTLGLNPNRGTPWNPWDAETHRAPGGSSSGSAVAAVAGLCAFAVGTDTGGSVRGPAAFCGAFGLKATVGLWPTNGMCPLSTTMDSIGILARSAADVATVFSALTGQPAPSAKLLRDMRLGKPENYFYDDLEPQVGHCMTAALAALEAAGVVIVPIEVPEALECPAFNATVSSTELVAALGRDRFLAGRDAMGEVVVASARRGLEVMADEYIRLINRQHELRRIAAERMEGLDGWITPTRPRVAMPLAEFSDAEDRIRLEAMMLRNTRPGNTFGICGISTPIHQLGSGLPVGLQVLCPANHDAEAMSIGLALQGLIGVPPLPDLAGFL